MAASLAEVAVSSPPHRWRGQRDGPSPSPVPPGRQEKGPGVVPGPELGRISGQAAISSRASATRRTASLACCPAGSSGRRMIAVRVALSCLVVTRLRAGTSWGCCRTPSCSTWPAMMLQSWPVRVRCHDAHSARPRAGRVGNSKRWLPLPGYPSGRFGAWKPGPIRGQAETLRRVQRALETAGVAFTNGGEPGVKLRHRE